MCVLTQVGEEAAEGQPPYEGSGEDKTAVPRPELDLRRPAEYEPAWERKEGIGRTLSGTDVLFNSIGLAVTTLASAVRRLHDTKRHVLDNISEKNSEFVTYF